MTRKKAIFIAATAQHVGKTTTCLGIISGLLKRSGRIGFMKPVGQRHAEVEEGLQVDKDVLLFRDHFHLRDGYEEMSPVLLPRGFTRSFLDGEVDSRVLRKRIRQSFRRIWDNNDYTVVEGTGHAGVGSIVDLSNADVAEALGLEVILVTNAGVGSAFDALALNWQLFASKGVRVRGIILNRVFEEKRRMIETYIPKALAKWKVPLLGCIPYNELLNAPTMADFECLFRSSLLAGEQHRYRHMLHDRLIATTVEHYRAKLRAQELIITPASRDDIIQAVIEDEVRLRQEHPEADLERGMILTGYQPPSMAMLELIRRAEMPVLHVPLSHYKATRKISGFTAKIRQGDASKIEKAIHLVESHVNFDDICR